MPFSHTVESSATQHLKSTCTDAVSLNDLLRTYGNQSISYSSTQHDLHYFGDSKTGVIPYLKKWGVTLALGNPLCASNQTENLCEQFLREHSHVMFTQVTGATAITLKSLGLHVTPAGMDCYLDLPSFDMYGKTKSNLRHYRNRAYAGGVVVEEAIDTSAIRKTLMNVSAAWMSTKKVHKRELAFLVRPLSNRPEPDTRIFVAKIGNAITGFVLFDPIYDEGEIIGYTTVINRAVPHAPEGTLDTIILEAAEQFRIEGKASLSLGVAPLHGMKDTARLMGKGAFPLYHACHQLYRMPWQPILNVRGLSFHKSRYRPEEHPVYLAGTSPIGILQMVALLRACKIL